jgi:hypothetical protein
MAALAAPGPGLAAVCDGISEAPASPLTTLRLASGLLRPAYATSPPGDTERIFLVEQDGRIRILKNGALLAAPFLDICALTRSPEDDPNNNEEGLLGLAFHPDYATNRTFFVYHTDATGANNLLVRYLRDATDPEIADAATRTVLLTFAHPSFNNHNGGGIHFAPDDGMLYVGTGDGGSGCDPADNAQNPASPLGKLLRVDVGEDPVVVTTWAMGLRNPWRWSFDRLTSDLYLADVGQNQWEEVNFRPAPRSAGDNFGWDLYEGLECPNPSCGSATCTVANLVLPVVVYSLSGAPCAVTGGYSYRGCRMPDLHGTYFYADFCAAFIRSFEMNAGSATNQLDRTAELAPGGGLAINSITSFGEDARGEILIVDRGGELFKIVPTLPNLQVSGVNAPPFALTDPDWIWEDLTATSSHPIASYRVYRNEGNGSGDFDCVFRSPTPLWPGGDPDVPLLDALFSYVVTGRNAAGQETSPGASTDGTPRFLSPLPCPS